MSNCRGVLIVTLTPVLYYTDVKDPPETIPCSGEGYMVLLHRTHWSPERDAPQPPQATPVGISKQYSMYLWPSQAEEL